MSPAGQAGEPGGQPDNQGLAGENARHFPSAGAATDGRASLSAPPARGGSSRAIRGMRAPAGALPPLAAPETRPCGPPGCRMGSTGVAGAHLEQGHQEVLGNVQAGQDAEFVEVSPQVLG